MRTSPHNVWYPSRNGMHGMRAAGIFCISSALIVSMFLPAIAAAADVSLLPVLIDEKAKPRDILKETLTIVNTSDRKLNLYPSVNDVNPEEGTEAFTRAQGADERSVSLANWIELSRGVVELGPGEEKSIPFVIRVNLNAVPGTYHAYISFYEGSTREAAEQSEPEARMAVNVEVQADIKEVLQLNKFSTDAIFFSGDDVLFNYQLENIGNQDLQPKGEIRIYDRRGKEVAAIDVNDDKQTISPDQVSQLASVWSAASGFGRYKAFLNVDFGKTQKASVQDTVYFWVVPWQQLIGLLVASLIAVVFLALYTHRAFELRHRARLAHALASAGVVAPTAAQSREKGPGILKRTMSAAASVVSRLPKRASRPAVEVQKAPEPPPAPEKKPERPTLRDRLPSVAPLDVQAPTPSRPRATGHAIDLKHLGAPSAPQRKPHHIINLKDS